jgi:hypothetical protein
MMDMYQNEPWLENIRMDVNTKIFGAIKRLLGFYKSIAFEQALRLAIGRAVLTGFRSHLYAFDLFRLRKST